MTAFMNTVTGGNLYKVTWRHRNNILHSVEVCPFHRRVLFPTGFSVPPVGTSYWITATINNSNDYNNTTSTTVVLQPFFQDNLSRPLPEG